MKELSSIELVGLFGICYILSQGLIEITKAAIARRVNGKKEEPATLSKEQEKQLQTLYDLHCKFDQDGLPLWFMPRSWGETLEKLVELIHDTAKSQEQSTKILEKIADKLN